MEITAIQGDSPCKNAALSLGRKSVKTQDAEFEMLAAPDSYQYAVTLLPRSLSKTSLAGKSPISWKTQTGNMYRFQKRVTSVSVHALLAVALAGFLTFGASGPVHAQDSSTTTETSSGEQPAVPVQAETASPAAESTEPAADSAQTPADNSAENPVQPAEGAAAPETAEKPAVSVPVAFDPTGDRAGAQSCKTTVRESAS